MAVSKLRRHCGWLLAVVSLFIPHGVRADETPANLVRDASFESRLPLWLERPPGSLFFADKCKNADAHDGSHVLVFRAWSQEAKPMLSPVVELNSDTVSAGLWVRCTGGKSPAGLRLALFDETGKKKRLDILSVELGQNGEWRQAKKIGCRAAAQLGRVRLAISATGPDEGRVVDIDQVALCAGDRLPDPVRDNDDTHIVHAEDMADGTVWEKAEHYASWYQGTPVGMAMLAGFKQIEEGQNKPVSTTLTIREGGTYRLWIRLLASRYEGGYTIALRQGDRTVGQKEINESKVKAEGETRFQWVWESLDVALEPGEVELVLTRPPKGVSWTTRKLDLFVLTDDLDFRPDVTASHFRSQAYLRYTNLSEGVEPYCLWGWIRRFQRPKWYANAGILTRAGFSEGWTVPNDRTLWLGPGDRSPWVNITPFLLVAGGRNNVALTATRKWHRDGFVEERIKGTLEFAVGEDLKVLRRVPIDQQAPRILFTLPGDFAAAPDEIKTPEDYIKRKQECLAKLGPPHGKRPTRLEVTTGLSLCPERDRADIIESEVQILKQLGFNGCYYAPAETGKEAEALYQRSGFPMRFGLAGGLFYMMKDQCQNQPDFEKMDAKLTSLVEAYGPILDRTVRMKLADEPSGMPFEHIVKCPVCKEQFVKDLKARNMTPEALGVGGWEQVVPVGPEKRKELPRLYYYTAMFRLESFARQCKASIERMKKHLPDTIRGYVNYSPPLAHGSWVSRGTDLFFAQRSALTMCATEDWLGHGAGPQQMSYCLALVRAAVAPERQPILLYVIGVSGGPIHQRLKFYEALAGGARSLTVFNYGPKYCSHDSWSDRFEIYPVVRDCLHEFGAIEDDLEGTMRRPTQVALLYNRTAAIWAADDCAERDAQFTYWALRHAGYDVDILPEEDIDAGALDRHRVLYMTGAHLLRKTAARISEWVRSGGVLYGSMGAGLFDEFNERLHTLDTVFGLADSQRELVADARRPLYELRGLTPLGKVLPVRESGLPQVEFKPLCYREKLTPGGGARVAFRFDDGSPAGLLNHCGKGIAIRFAVFPGIDYIHDAVQAEEYWGEKGREATHCQLPRRFRAELRDLIAWAAEQSGSPRVAVCDAPVIEFTRYDADDRAVLFLIDHNLDSHDRFAFTLPDAAQFGHALSARGRPLRLEKLPDGGLRIELPLTVADVVVLRR